MAKNSRHPINLRNFDLNLFVVLNAIADEKHLGNAADRLGLTRSAVSHALRRLRITFADPLFNRTPDGMIPTPWAETLIQSIRESLLGIQDAIGAQLTFDPKTSDREFTIMTSDFLLPYVASPIAKRVYTEAPGIRLTAYPSASGNAKSCSGEGERHVRTNHEHNCFQWP